MLGSLANAWKVPELRRRLMFTAAIIAAYRLGAFVPLPGISREALATGLQTGQNAITGLFGVFTGGGFNKPSGFSRGFLPYITRGTVIPRMDGSTPRSRGCGQEGGGRGHAATAATQ